MHLRRNGFLCCCNGSVDDDDKQKTNGGGGVATATISACLKALSGVGVSTIVALSLQCQLDAGLLRMLQRHLGQLRLQRIAWHSLLMVHYDAKNGCIKWLPQAPQVARAMLRFIVSQAAVGLRELDLTRNVHATSTFLAQLDEQLLQPPCKLAVWHDGCPRAGMSNEETDMASNRNDLAFVQLELKQLKQANEKPNSYSGNSVLLADELYNAVSRYLDKQQAQNAIASQEVCPVYNTDESVETVNPDQTSLSSGQLTIYPSFQGVTDSLKRISRLGNQKDMNLTPQPMHFSNSGYPQNSQNRHRKRSHSAPPPKESTRDCQRGADAFCTIPQDHPHSFLGLQPTHHYQSNPTNILPEQHHQQQQQQQHQQQQQQQQPRKAPDCSTCPNRPAGNVYQMSYEPTQSHRTCPADDSSNIAISYGKWIQHQQQQRQLNQQQQQQQQLALQRYQQQRERNGSWLRNDGAVDNFEPGLNSTMIGSGAAAQPAYCAQSWQQQPQLQQLQQLVLSQQQQQQHPQQSSSFSSSVGPYEQIENEAYAARCMPQRLDMFDSHDATEYMQLPAAGNRRALRQNPQQRQQQQQQVTFRDPVRASSSADTIRSRSDNCTGPSQNTCCQNNMSMQQRSDNCQGPSQKTCCQHNMSMPQTTPPYQPKTGIGSASYCGIEDSIQLSMNNNNACSAVVNQNYLTRKDPFFDNTTPEERYIQRTNTLFLETLVLDQSCPGLIQETLSGLKDFNKYAFDIAFGDTIPDKPHPVDPISLLEAIQLRIDHERKEISKRCPENLTIADGGSDSTTSVRGNRSKKSVHSGKNFRDKNDEGKSQLMNSINQHFSSKNKSEVNEGIHAFLTAETCFQNLPRLGVSFTD
ncbi:GH18005 [Drosophila grimshawi]|uniref:GH18005 n=1 Tax=Drosophila grimshawi TaxID=7222 RepID=B4K0Y3_DROGR|nr:GH18005 [Drosophila grimshawi]